jgi:hypothetical protein
MTHYSLFIKLTLAFAAVGKSDSLSQEHHADGSDDAGDDDL